MELLSHHQLEEFRKGQKETPRVLPPPESLLAGIHLGLAMCMLPGKTLSRNYWPKTNCNNPMMWVGLGAMWQGQFPWVPLPSHPGALFHKISCIVNSVSLGKCFQGAILRAYSQALEKSLFLQQNCEEQGLVTSDPPKL